MTRFPLVLLLLLGGCSLFGGGIQNKETSPCPPPQYADEKVAAELKTIPFEGYEDTWAWVDRVEKLNEQLEVCRK